MFQQSSQCLVVFPVAKSDLLFRVLPVVLYGPNCAIETYALLDEGSSVTIVDSSLVRQLGKGL